MIGIPKGLADIILTYELRRYVEERRELEERYRPTQKRNKDGTFAYEGKKSLTKGEKSGTISSSEFIRSLRSTGKRYPIKGDGRDHVQLDTEKDIENAAAFAGKGTKREIRNRRFLENNYHIAAEEWQKCSGFGYVIKNGISIKAELHWYQANGTIVEPKVKRWYDESEISGGHE